MLVFVNPNSNQKTENAVLMRLLRLKTSKQTKSRDIKNCGLVARESLLEREVFGLADGTNLVSLVRLDLAELWLVEIQENRKV